jgi:hypothetical protein
MQRVLIVEDTMNDLALYRPLFSADRKVFVALVTPNPEAFSGEQAYDALSVIYEDVAKSISRIFTMERSGVPAFLAERPFDVYLFDSLGGTAEDIVKHVQLPREKVAFFTSTGPFKEQAEKDGFRAYKKSGGQMEELVRDVFKRA